MAIKQRIGGIASAGLICTAVGIDLTQAVTKLFHLIPVVGNASAIAIGITLTISSGVGFTMWFAMHDISLLDRIFSRFFLFIFAGLIELIPIINALPGITLYVTTTVILVRLEDARYNKNNSGSTQKVVRYEE